MFRLNLENFKAINNADIYLNGITVVSGINGCGKSTLSKLMYYTIKTYNDFDLLVIREANQLLDKYHQIFSNIFQEVYLFNNEDISNFFDVANYIENKMYEAKQDLNNKDFSNKTLIKVLNIVDFVRDKVLSQKEEIKLNRIKSIILNELGVNIDNIDAFFTLARESLSEIIGGISKNVELKPKYFLDNVFNDVFNNVFEPGRFNVYEDDIKIISTGNSFSISPYSLKNAIYIDTPMSMESYNGNNGHWDDLKEMLNIKISKKHNKDLTRIISDEILMADVDAKYNEFTDYPEFKYYNYTSKLVLDLNECATGIKALATIQILLKNNSINDKTLLIIDEPEAHLHPQWIVEYARILILLYKTIGCRIFIASHSPDFIQALRMISEKEDILKNLNFYLAEDDNHFRFNYINLENNIEPIFRCFNKSLDKIESYSQVQG